MLYWLAKLLTPHYSGFNVFSYLTVRAIFAVIIGARARPCSSGRG